MLRNVTPSSLIAYTASLSDLLAKLNIAHPKKIIEVTQQPPDQQRSRPPVTRPVTIPVCVRAGQTTDPSTIPDSHLRNAGLTGELYDRTSAQRTGVLGMRLCAQTDHFWTERHPPHRRGAHPDAQAGQLALDPQVPQPGFSRAIRSISATTCESTGGLPPRCG
jgi:hypothetical protein